MFLNSSGEIIHKFVGNISLKLLLVEAKNAIGNETLSTLKKKYIAGERDLKFMLSYLKAIAKAGESNQRAENYYFSSISKKELVNDEIFDLIYRLSNNIDGEAYKTLVKYRNEFIEIKDEETVELVINTIQARHIYTNVDSLELFEKCLNRINNINPDIARTIGCAGYIYLKEYKKGLLLILGDGRESNNSEVNNLMISYFMRFSNYLNKNELKYYNPLITNLAKKLSKNSVLAMDNYAKVLYLSGDIHKAKKVASKVMKDTTTNNNSKLWSNKFLNQ